jgi:hypothetical protein
MMIVAATCQVLIFGWIIGARRGVAEMNYGADFRVPRFVAFVIRFVTPTFLIVVLVMWAGTKLPSYWNGMNPEYKGLEARRNTYVDAIEEHFADEKLTEKQLEARAVSLLGPEGTPIAVASLPEWLRPEEAKAEEKGAAAAEDASIARFVFLGILVFYILLWVLSDLACRYRIKPMIERAENAGINSGAQI